MRRFFFSLLLSAALAHPADLPVKQVVLYKHGVGFFERSGRLGPGESARLDFNAAEMNDVLKSLTIAEPGGGKISGLRYDSMDPLSHKLAEFPFRIGQAEALSAMLDQLKGGRLELKFGNETVTGVIVNGRLIAGSDKAPEREQLTLLLDSGEMRNVDLSAATGIRFPDTQLQQQFKDYLAAVAAARSKDKRSVYIDSTDAKEREVVASYTIPSPVWKSSYRLIFGASGQPVIEGWGGAGAVGRAAHRHLPYGHAGRGWFLPGWRGRQAGSSSSFSELSSPAALARYSSMMRRASSASSAATLTTVPPTPGSTSWGAAMAVTMQSMPAVSSNPLTTIASDSSLEPNTCTSSSLGIGLVAIDPPPWLDAPIRLLRLLGHAGIPLASAAGLDMMRNRPQQIVAEFRLEGTPGDTDKT